jgi:two-component system cell cycle sensor histidine kinase/response regulator CckA
MAAPLPIQPYPATVLVVDDEELMRSVLTRTMEAEHYRVYAAADGVEALALLEKGVPVDLVIADVSMPRMDGRQLVLELSRRHPHMPVVLISGVYLGGTPDLPGPVLPKPFTPMALASRVREVLALHGPVRRSHSAGGLSSDQFRPPIV